MAEFSEPACVIVKHANPCGVGLGANLLQAYEKAFATDPTSAFGGIIAFNRQLDAEVLKVILDRQFVEVVIAPTVAAAAVEIARQKKMLAAQLWRAWCRPRNGIQAGRRWPVVTRCRRSMLDESALQVVTKAQPTPQQMADLHFAWKVAWFTKSNAIVYARDGQTIGVGAGQ